MTGVHKRQVRTSCSLVNALFVELVLLIKKKLLENLIVLNFMSYMKNIWIL